MLYKIILPPDHLKDTIRNFFFLESLSGDAVPPEYQSMADGCPEIIFQYGGGFKEYANIDAYLRPQHSSCKRLHIGKSIGLFGIRLYPDVLQQVFNIPPTEIVNRTLDLRDLIKDRDMIEQIMSSSSNEQRIQLISSFFQHHRYDKPIDPLTKLVRKVMNGEGRVDISGMRQLAGLSTRQFERRFKSAAGFTPLYYARMMRFQNTKKRYALRPFNTLAELATDCGYADQSHFIREFKEFGGMNPASYFKLLNNTDNKESQIIKGLIIAKNQSLTN